eukprot:scaffold3602_cov66-Cyclotella_meneghiniana.AAC.5
MLIKTDLEPLISSIDGFNVTLMAFGQNRRGKTHSFLGSLESHGVQLWAKQLFNIAEHQTDRFKMPSW